MGRPKGSKNKPKENKRDVGFLEAKENKTALEHEIVIQKKMAQARKRNNEPPKVLNLVKNYEEEHAGPPTGEPVGHCNVCGKDFEQEFSADRNAYSSYRTCPECRRKRSKKLETRIDKSGKHEETVAKLPYKPYPWQVEAEEAFNKHRFIVLACGNRSGKDRATIMIAIKYFVELLRENRIIENPDMVPPVLWWQIAPTEKMAKQNWRELKQFFPKEWVIAVSDSTYTMETVGGGIIEVRSGYDEENLVGVGLDLVTITEAARFKDLHRAWANLEGRLISEGRGSKKDRMGMKPGKGKAIINSSPLGRNDFYDLFMRGQKTSNTYSSDWWSAQYPWTCNPSNEEAAKELKKTKYGLKTYEEILRMQIGDRAYRSNFLADFLAEDTCVFRSFEDKCVINIFDQSVTGLKTAQQRKDFLKEWKAPIPGATYCIGYDPATGSSGDSPVAIVRHKESGRVVRAYDLYGKDYREQYDFIAGISKTFNYAEVRWLRTGHTAIEGEFENRGVPEVPLDEQGQKKAQLVQTLELAIENGDVQVLYDGSDEIQTLINQMNDYSEKKGKYSNDKMPHDDFVSGMYAAFSDYKVAEIPIFYSGMMSAIYQNKR